MEKKGARKMSDKEEKKDAYVPPEITTYTSEEILEEIGPAQACASPGNCAIP